VVRSLHPQMRPETLSAKGVGQAKVKHLQGLVHQVWDASSIEQAQRALQQSKREFGQIKVFRFVGDTLRAEPSGRSLWPVGATPLPLARFALQASVHEADQALAVEFGDRLHLIQEPLTPLAVSLEVAPFHPV